MADGARIVVEPSSATPAPLEPLTVGIPFPRATCTDPGALRLHRESHAVPLQTSVLARWADGSLKWVLLDFQAAAARAAEYRLTWPGGPATAPRQPVAVVRDGDTVSVSTGAASFVVRRNGAFPLDSGAAGGVDLLGAETMVEDARGGVHRAIVNAVKVLESGPVRASVAVESIVPVDGRALALTAVLHFFAGSGVARVELTVGNPDRARHRGGFWELGDEGSILLRDLSCVLKYIGAANAGQIFCAAEIDACPDAFTGSVELYQDSSGGAQWDGPNHVNRHGRNPNRFCGYELKTSAGTRHGRRASPFVACAKSMGWIAVTPHEFWHNAPKALEADDSSIAMRLWPRQYADLHELQGGEQKTHVFHVAAGPGAFDANAIAWCRRPSLVRADPEWYCASGVNAYLTAAASDPHAVYLSLVNSAVEGPASFEEKRETVDEYGWRNYGDIYADHETAFHSGPGLLVSHYNNQYDVLAGLMYQFMRTGDVRFWRLTTPLAEHVNDIDVYHTSRDKAAYNGGSFWHTIHYEDAGRSTHRSYPRSAKTHGGGPSSEHNYTTGLMLHYFMTGQQRSRETAIGLARWVVAMDDGRLTPFRWLARGATGLASATNSAQAPGRGAGNSIVALLDGHALTGERAFLDKADEIIRRCVHPADDPAVHDLLDRERRWSYVVFLQALGRYLDYKRELGEIDPMWSYARASLLTYARWMAENEFPYLDKPEMLEFPNETWPAQDMRKSEVFKYAAAHSTGGERERFLERARFFFDYSTTTLIASPHHGRTRPTVLMLQHGYSEALFRSNPPAYECNPPDAAFPAPTGFVPQKTVAMKRALIAGAAGVVAVIVTVLAWLV